jgi:hypothetical protein
MNVATDPYRGMTYSQVLESMSPDSRRKYYERPHALITRPRVGITVWDATIGRHVTV